MIGQMANVIAAWILQSWTFGDPYFSFDGSFLYRFSTLSKKIKKIFRPEV